MDRPRHKRRDPNRTGPIRNAGEAWREGEPSRDSSRRRGDAASSGVREGYRLIDEQIRRGRQMAQELGDEPRAGERSARYDRERRRPEYPGEPRYRDGEEPGSRHGGGPLHLLGMPLRHLERLVREILRQVGSARPDPWRLAELLFRLQIEAISELARLGFGTLGMAAPRWGDSFEEDSDRVARDIDETLEEIEEEEEEELELEDEPWDWPAAPSAPATIRSTVPIPVYVWSHERTEIDLELPAGAQSLDLMVESLLVISTDQPSHPAFEAAFVALAYGPVILRIEVPRDLPAGRYRRRILVCGTGEPVGDLTVQVGIVPIVPIVTVPPVAAVAKKARKR
jgi:hypothetical protein